MIKTSTITIRTDDETKAAIEYLYGRFGLNVSDAVNIFFSKSLMEHGLPFDMKLPCDQETLGTPQEARGIMPGKVKAKAYKTLAEVLGEEEEAMIDDADDDA